jgi:tryptophan-rich sensory protein
MRKNDAAAIAVGAVLAAAVLGSRHSPTSVRDLVWYERLEKPSYRPPGAAIGAAWTALDILLAYAGARLLAAPASPTQRVATAGWSTAVSGLVLYPWLMFGRKRLGWALGSVVWMLGGTVTAVAAGASVDRTAAKALLPLVGWLGFAGVLQEEIWRRNRG